jgi:hypothetical protein
MTVGNADRAKKLQENYGGKVKQVVSVLTDPVQLLAEVFTM